MATPARVLLLGTEQDHMETRAAILEHFWRVGVLVVDPGTEVRLGAEVVVVCETLPDTERHEWVQRVRHHSPSALVVKMNGHPAGPHAGADATVDEADGPGALVATIYELLTERGLESRDGRWPGNPSG